MLLLLTIALGIYAITKRKVHITSNWTVTGRNARNFGVAVVVVTLAAWFLAGRVLPLVLPAGVVNHPIGGRLVVLGVLVVLVALLALAFEDETPARVNW